MAFRRRTGNYDMTSGPIIGPMIRYAVPLMFSGMLQMLFNAADTAVVGRFAGEHALAAVGATGALCALFTNLFIGLSVGANVAAARSCGARDAAELNRVVHTSMTLSLICGFIVMTLGLVFSPMVLNLMGTPVEIIDDSALYLRIYFVGMLPSMIYNFGSALLRAAGDTRRPMTYLIIAGVVNVILNLIFVICFDMSVAGVGIATAVSQAVAATLVVISLVRSNNYVRLDLRSLRIHKAAAGLIIRIGLPAGLQSTLFCIANVVIQSAYNSFGADAVAGNAVGSNIDGFVSTAMGAFDQAAVTFTGQNYGARKFSRIKKVMGSAVLLNVVVGIPASTAVWYFGESLMRIYTDSQPVLDVGMIRLTLVCLPYFIAGIMNITTSMLRGIGRSLVPTVVTVCAVCGFRLLWIYTVCRLPRFENSLAMVYASYPISWGLNMLVLLVYFAFAMRSLMKNAEKDGLPANS